jgi:arylsulfatase A-like enzyme
MLAFGLLGALLACAPGDAPGSNVLLLLADDVGQDVLRLYGEGDDLPVTPALDRLAREGVLFERAWANPTCSSTRATLLTGRYAFRTGVDDIIDPASEHVLQREEWTLPEALARARPRPAHALFGKWHLGNDRNGGERGPNLAGFDHFSGSLGAFPAPSYGRWSQVRNGETRASDVYPTTQLVDEALAWIRGRDEAWFAEIAFQAAHRPWHVPPGRLVGARRRATLPRSPNGSLPDPSQTCPDAYARACYLAMVEALSAEIGRLLEALPADQRARTHVIFVADNGTPRPVSGAPRHQSKGQLYEGGIRVPLIVSGPSVVRPGRRSRALVHTVDLYATVLELVTGRPADAFVPENVTLDARSLVPLLRDEATAVHAQLLAERLRPGRAGGRGRAIRDERFKLIQWQDREELYDLERDPQETRDLAASRDPEVARSARALREALTALSPRSAP